MMDALRKNHVIRLCDVLHLARLTGVCFKEIEVPVRCFIISYFNVALVPVSSFHSAVIKRILGMGTLGIQYSSALNTFGSK